jgi:predicted nucleotidyltransferase
MLDVPALGTLAEQLVPRPLFVTVSGAHLYGFPSPDSDIDLRGCHRAELRDVVGLHLSNETIEREAELAGIEVELVSHEVGKYLRLLLRNNGYILEQIFSPLVVLGQDFLDRLRPLAQRCVTRHHYHHYRGFYATQRKLIEKEDPKRAKPILYAYRVLLSGIHLLNTGEVQAHLPTLAQRFDLPFLDSLIASKVAEDAAAANLDWPAHAARLAALEVQLDQSFDNSHLPEDRDHTAVNEFLVDLRLAGMEGCK